MTCLLAISLQFLFLGQARLAWADELPDFVPRTVEGSCHIGGSWTVGENTFFTIPSFYGPLEGAVPSSTFHCIDYTAAAPEHVDATYVGSVSAFSLKDGWVEYDIVITPPGVTDGVSRDELGRLYGYQRAQGTVRIAYRFNGSIELAKRSSNTGISKNNANYTLKGAIYGVFDDEDQAKSHSPSHALCTFETDANGTWASGEDFSAGTYYVAETSAPVGFALDKSVYKVKVIAGQRVKVNAGVGYVSDAPKSNPVSIWAKKLDAETSDGGPQGNASRAGAQFKIDYYDGYYKLSTLPETPTRSWTVTCGEDGIAYARDDLKVSGDDFYRTESGEITIPLGTVTVREAAAPDTYQLGDGSGTSELKLIKIRSSDTSKIVGAYVAPEFSDYVKRGGLVIGKVDRQTLSYTAQGAASLDGATVAIVNSSAKSVIVDGASFEPGEIVKVIETAEEDGRHLARTPQFCLPIGRYTIVETTSPKGYIFDEQSQNWSSTINITEHGQVVDLSDAQDAVANQVARGDIAFSKIDGQTARRLASIPFLVTSATTGEAHVLVTDDNGMASSAARWVPHTSSTNSNDAAVSPRGDDYAVDEAALDANAGIWFSGSSSATCDPDDSLGALPYDTYSVRELRTTSNEGYHLASFSAHITRHGVELDMGTVDDNAGPALSTSLADANGLALAAANSEIVLSDSVFYSNLDTSETYTLVGALHAVGSDGADRGTVAQASQQLKPSAPAGTIKIDFKLDTSSVDCTHLVAFEQLYANDGRLVAEHADLDDEGQTVRIPAIHTQLHDRLSGTHDAACADDITLVDTVHYHNLTPGLAYTVLGVLHARDEEGLDAGPAHDAHGREIAASQTFVAQVSDGDVEVAFTFPASNLAGTTLVAFEQLQCRGICYATHEDIDDEGQSVRLAQLATTLLGAETGDHIATAHEAIVLVDTLSYRNLTPSEEYSIKGTLHIRNDNGSDAGCALDAHGDEITTTASFVAEESSGEVKVTFTFDAPDLAGRTVIAFEELSLHDQIHATHADISDDSQAVRFEEPDEMKGEPPVEHRSPSTPASNKQSPEAPKSSLPNTGDLLDMLPLAIVAAAALGLAIAALCIRSMQRGAEIYINRGPRRP